MLIYGGYNQLLMELINYRNIALPKILSRKIRIMDRDPTNVTICRIYTSENYTQNG
jgi:hypothetical protein